MSSSADSFSEVLEKLKKLLGSVTFHSALGGTKTELYCLLSSDAANSGSGLGDPEAGSIKGPTPDLVFCLDLAKL